MFSIVFIENLFLVISCHCLLNNIYKTEGMKAMPDICNDQDIAFLDALYCDDIRQCIINAKCVGAHKNDLSIMLELFGETQ